MNIYQSNTNRKDLSWLYFDNESKVPANPSILKDYFSSTTDPSILYINSTSVIRPVKQKKLSFFNIEINKLLSALVYCVSDQIQVQKPILFVVTDQMLDHRVVSSIISIDRNVTDDIIKKVINDSRKSVGPRMEH